MNKVKITSLLLSAAILTTPAANISAQMSGENLLTRATAVNEITSLFAPKTKADISMFVDAKADDKLFDALSKAVAMKIMSGTSANTLSPDENITFEQLVAIMQRLLAIKEAKADAEYKYMDNVSEWAKLGFNALLSIEGAADDLLANKPDAVVDADTYNKIIKLFIPNIIERQEDFKTLVKGNVLVKSNVEIKDLTIDGDIIFADCLKGEQINIKNVTAKRAVIRGGAVNIEASKIDIVVDLAKEEVAEVIGDDYKRGFANVDGRNYPVVSPFIHPPFYNVRVAVKLDDAGKIVKVLDDSTGKIDTTGEYDRWKSKNGKFWDVVKETKTMEKFVGKTLAEVEAMNFESGGPDAVSGATESGRALKEAVINAITGKSGKAFLKNDETLVVESVANDKVIFINKLPKEFALKLHSVAYGVYNMNEVIDAGDYEFKEASGKYELNFKKPLKPGHYYVNIVDEKGGFRSPDFESGHGAQPHYPRFIVENASKIAYENGKLTIVDATITDVLNNIDEIVVKDKSLIGTTVKDKSGKDVPYAGVVVEPVGHHGTVDASYKKFPIFNADGMINLDAVAGKKAEKVFVSGHKYIIEVDTYGFGKVEFEFEVAGEVTLAPEVKKEEIKKPEIKKEEPKKIQAPADKKVESVTKKVSATTKFGYDIVLNVTIGNGKILKVTDAGTDAGSSESFYKKSKAMFTKLQGKTLAEIDGVDTVSGATNSSSTIKEAVKKAFK